MVCKKCGSIVNVDDKTRIAYIVYLNDGEYGEFEDVDYDEAVAKYFGESAY